MKFELGKCTEITELYKKYNESLQEDDGYIRFFICLDIKDFWIIRIVEGFNIDYEKTKDVYLMELNKIQKESKKQNLNLSTVIRLIKDDDFSNWDVKEFSSMDQMIEIIDGGFGIN